MTALNNPTSATLDEATESGVPKSPRSPQSLKSLLVTGTVAGGVAALATAAVAAAAHAAGVSLDLSGQPIPASGFFILTVVFSLVGLGIAVAIRRWAARPRRTFVVTTLVLTALSWVPDLIADAAVSTKVLLMVTHAVAAAIVIPAVARRLSTARGDRR